MLRPFQITAASIAEVMDRYNEVRDEMRKLNPNSMEYKELARELKFLEERINIHLRATEIKQSQSLNKK